MEVTFERLQDELLVYLNRRKPGEWSIQHLGHGMYKVTYNRGASCGLSEVQLIGGGAEITSAQLIHEIKREERERTAKARVTSAVR